MFPTLGLALSGAALLGLVALLAQYAAVRRHLADAPRTGGPRPRISILKPLCGVDDDLAANLETFAALSYPEYEVLLGLEHAGDGAAAVAREFARRHPGRFRVVVQRGAPGLNPKVNQLLTLAAAARHDVFVISDSNVQVAPHYLDEIAAHLADERCGLVTHPIVGAGGRSLGSRMDNLQLGCGVAPGMIGAQRLGGRDVVVGKSMALRRADLEALGGFAAVKDVLAEDYLLGVMVGRRLGKRVVVARTPVVNVSRDQAVAGFLGRFRRWSVIQRRAVGRPIYAAQLLLHPSMLALAACAAAPRVSAALAAAAVVGAKAALDASSIRALAGRRLGARDVPALLLKDFVLWWAWAFGLVKSEVTWRGKRLRVLDGTRLVPVAAPLPVPDLEAPLEAPAA